MSVNQYLYVDGDLPRTIQSYKSTTKSHTNDWMYKARVKSKSKMLNI